MNPFKVMAKVGRRMTKPAAKTLAKISKNKPEIFIGAGLLMVIGSFVWVAVEATKAPETMTASSDKVKYVEDKYAAIREEETTRTQEEVTALAKSEKKELRVARIDGILAMTKLFGGPVLLLMLGSGLIVHGHHLLVVRNAILGATLKSTEQMFRFYRDNVIAKEGKEADQRYMRGIIGETEVLTPGVDECGNEIMEKKTVPVVRDGNPWRFEFSPKYFGRAVGVPDHDLTVLNQVEEYFNRIYNGHKKHDDISMYEIFEYLEAKWEALDPGNEKHLKQFTRNNGWGHDARGDDFISLGVYEAINELTIHGGSEKVYFEMNCDGRLDTLVNQYSQRYIQA